ncbi:hypothetical protein B0T16DRAFT_430243 [Cercophora newfieldiana]|uniref:Uncharacterized protein n=1 Tax=Cercophora newfieldiana TaxID=92897 RepID=A0AA39Y107_9PEZI|nr:hypothetical protein B0T16DRAFT_430243 [Cercophora newfieldiana]
MKYLAIAALTTTALATPLSPPVNCTFGTYRCTTPNTGIEICNVLNQWELVGPCPSGTECTNLPQNGFTLPFCTNKVAPAVHKRNGRPGQSPGEKCSTAGKYDCFGPYAIQVCDTQNVLQKVGDCPSGSHCDNLNGIPFCVANV